MPISKENKCIFIHIPKCAGSSIESALGMHGDIDYIGLKPYLKQKINDETLFGCEAQHYSALEIRNIVNKDIFENYFKFSIVRNPWERFISHVAWSKGIWDKSNTLTKSDVDLALKKLKETPENLLNNHLKHQWKYLCDENGNILCDYVGRFESLTNDWSIVCKEIGVDLSLPKRMVSHHEHYSKYLDDDQVDFLASFYEKDISQFGYQFERIDDF